MNKIARVPRAAQQVAAPSQQDWNGGNWWWGGGDGGCDDNVPPFPCPPPGFPPPGCPPWFSGVNSPPWYPGANAGVSFGTTAPPNPVRGHMWWDGAVMWLFDGAAWVTIGGSGAAATTPPSSTAPANPQNGQQWFNGTTLYVWDGDAWVPVSQTKSTISPTAPPSPNPGDTWWDGTQMHIWDGTAWRLVGPGASAGPVPTTTHTFSLVQPTNLTLGADNTYVIVPFTATPTIDTTSGWNAATNKFQPKTPGYYLFNTRSWLETPETDASHALMKSDPGTFPGPSGQYVTFQSVWGPGTAVIIQGSGVVYLNGTTDFVRLWGYSSDGTFNTPGAAIPVVDAYILP